MRVIDNHLRQCRRQCEEQRRYLAELELLAERLRGDAIRLQGEVKRPSPTESIRQATAERHAKVERSLAAIEAQIVTAAAGLAAIEAELQGYERAFLVRRGAPLRTGRNERRGRRTIEPSNT